MGGDEFAVILTDKRYDAKALEFELAGRIERVRQEDARIPTLSVGYAEAGPACPNIRAVIELADQRMYQAKRRNHEQG